MRTSLTCPGGAIVSGGPAEAPGGRGMLGPRAVVRRAREAR
jgi:hypothetical protein